MRMSLALYEDRFKAVVLEHMLTDMPHDEWTRLRSFAEQRQNYVSPSFVADLGATPKELIEAALSEDSISLNEMLVPKFRENAVEVGRIDDCPVMYVKGRGIYAWSNDPKDGFTLTVWVTHPAYPPDY